MLFTKFDYSPFLEIAVSEISAAIFRSSYSLKGFWLGPETAISFTGI